MCSSDLSAAAGSSETHPAASGMAANASKWNSKGNLNTRLYFKLQINLMSSLAVNQFCKVQAHLQADLCQVSKTTCLNGYNLVVVSE